MRRGLLLGFVMLLLIVPPFVAISGEAVDDVVLWVLDSSCASTSAEADDDDSALDYLLFEADGGLSRLEVVPDMDPSRVIEPVIQQVQQDLTEQLQEAAAQVEQIKSAQAAIEAKLKVLVKAKEADEKASDKDE